LKNERNLTLSQAKDKLSELKHDFASWQSEQQINKFIQKTNIQKTDLERIPYSQLTNIQYLAEGGFAKIYQAE
jgi:hypothetical protein